MTLHAFNKRILAEDLVRIQRPDDREHARQAGSRFIAPILKRVPLINHNKLKRVEDDKETVLTAARNGLRMGHRKAFLKTTIPLKPERQAELEEFAHRRGKTPADALDEALAAYLEWE